MAGSGGILLTGCTGQLGRYLLRELLDAGRTVAVLLRGDEHDSPDERLREVHAFASDTLRRTVPIPKAIPGDLRLPGLGLGPADRTWLSNHCGEVLHAAASVSFRERHDGEPWTTNALGTRRLLDCCRQLGIEEFHHVSTAYVCGDRPGRAFEDDAGTEERLSAPRNSYEQSKLAAETMVRNHPSIRPTIYRPSIIVGDSRTGYTRTYHGLYRLWELADRIVRSEWEPRKRGFPIRLRLDADERRNLVPVDWVAGAIARIVGRRACHGRTYHLTSRSPTRVKDVVDVAVGELGLEGIVLAGSELIPDPSPLERALMDGCREYWRYLHREPEFECQNTLAALPDFPAPRVDRPMLTRLIRFAVRDGWGRGRRRLKVRGGIGCAEYIAAFVPRALEQSRLRMSRIECTIALVIRGPGGGRFLCRCAGGRIRVLEHAAAERPEVEYRMDVSTFAAIVSGRESPQAAFFARRIRIKGSMEKALKLAVMFAEFAKEFPYHLEAVEEKAHAAVIGG